MSSGETINPSHVISTLPLPALHKIVSETEGFKASPLPHLLANDAVSVQVLNLVFPPSSRPRHPPGFGFLVPRPPNGYPTSPTFEGPDGQPILQNVLGVVFDSFSDENFNPVTQPTVMTMMMGGAFPSYYPPGMDEPSSNAAPSTTSHTLSPSALKIYTDTLNYYLKKEGKAAFPEPTLHALHVHSNCIPTYRPGHLERMSELEKKKTEGVWGERLRLAGTVMHPSLGNCVKSAREAALSCLGKGVASGVRHEKAGGSKAKITVFP